jgi:hypothetical protein
MVWISGLISQAVLAGEFILRSRHFEVAEKQTSATERKTSITTDQ